MKICQHHLQTGEALRFTRLVRCFCIAFTMKHYTLRVLSDFINLFLLTRHVHSQKTLLFSGSDFVRRITMMLIVLSMFLFVVGCTSDKAVESKTVLPDDIPDFVREIDFETIDWERKAVEFGDRGIIGNENKSGVIGADMPSLNRQKWMWHLWGIENLGDTKLTVVGYHKESETVHQILINGWTTELSGANNGADAHTPSSVKIPKSGKWAILLYNDEKLFDVLVYDIKE
jgi:hypothetical protein